MKEYEKPKINTAIFEVDDVVLSSSDIYLGEGDKGVLDDGEW